MFSVSTASPHTVPGSGDVSYLSGQVLLDPNDPTSAVRWCGVGDPPRGTSPSHHTLRRKRMAKGREVKCPSIPALNLTDSMYADSSIVGDVQPTTS